MEKAKVSIIVPCFNYGRFLGTALESLISQTYSHWECIVVDDGSTDDTREVTMEYILKDKRIRYLYQKNTGASAARNFGIKCITGDFVCFLDADDLLAPNKLELHINRLVKDNTIDIIYSDVRYFLSEGPLGPQANNLLNNHKWMSPKISGSGKEVFPLLIDKNIMTVNAAVFKKKLFDKVGTLDESLRAVEDWEFWMRCSLAGAYFFFEPDEHAFAFVRIHDASLSKNISNLKRTELCLRQRVDVEIQKNNLRLSDEVKLSTLSLNRFKMAQLNIRYFKFLKGWHQNIGVLFSGLGFNFILLNGLKSTIKRIVSKN